MEPREFSSWFATTAPRLQPRAVPSWAAQGQARAGQPRQEVHGCHPSAAPWLQNSGVLSWGPCWGPCSLTVRPSPNPGQAAAQAISARELQSGEKLLHIICNYKVTLIPRLQYTNDLPNLKEKWLVLSRETKTGTSWLYVFHRGMFLCTFIPYN